jgi:beta-glucosidase/6-phospho-beta-glucosidase/beta-galactosidase
MEASPVKKHLSCVLAGLIFGVGCRTTSGPTASDPYGALQFQGASFSKDFLFGVATAPAHVEDQLDDTWLEFAKDRKKNGVKAWTNAGYPDLRLKFWTDYKTEIDLAAETGSKIFRMGVDWGRLVPRKPVNSCPKDTHPCYEGILDRDALKHYQKIIKYVRSKDMSVMLTLFHHSVPKWLNELTVDSKGEESLGGWTNNDTPDYFFAFAKDVVLALKSDVDIWVIFNEPAVFSSLAYGAGIWPPAQGMDYLALFKLGSIEGNVARSNSNMIKAHNRIYSLIKQFDTVETGDLATAKFGPAYVGIAHNVGYHTGRGALGKAIASYMRGALNYSFIDGVIDSLDFLGLNYYGEEVISANGVPPVSDKEYSESGRAVNPQGFYLTLKDMNDRYIRDQKSGKIIRSIPIWITENGISDGTDILRKSYLIEHLLALKAAEESGIPIAGYVFWTVSDNWEWADGYCPKFGLAEVDRSSRSLKRKPRESFKLFQKIVKNRQILPADRDLAWQNLASNFDKPRPFCRSSDGQNSLDTPVDRPFVRLDWRFTLPTE